MVIDQSLDPETVSYRGLDEIKQVCAAGPCSNQRFSMPTKAHFKLLALGGGVDATAQTVRLGGAWDNDNRGQEACKCGGIQKTQ